MFFDYLTKFIDGVLSGNSEETNFHSFNFYYVLDYKRELENCFNLFSKVGTKDLIDLDCWFMIAYFDSFLCVTLALLFWKWFEFSIKTVNQKVFKMSPNVMKVKQWFEDRDRPELISKTEIWVWKISN